MNSTTRADLIRFITCVELLAQGTIHMIGVEQCTTIMMAAEQLKDSLLLDETIP